MIDTHKNCSVAHMSNRGDDAPPFGVVLDRGIGLAGSA